MPLKINANADSPEAICFSKELQIEKAEGSISLLFLPDFCCLLFTGTFPFSVGKVLFVRRRPYITSVHSFGIPKTNLHPPPCVLSFGLMPRFYGTNIF